LSVYKSFLIFIRGAFFPFLPRKIKEKTDLI